MRVPVVPEAHGYTFTREEAATLSACALMPPDLRAEILGKYLADYGPAALLSLFGRFMGLANSVGENARDLIEEFLVIDAKMDPHEAEKINLPTVLGALQGIRVSIPPVKGMCHDCAYRHATPANQSPVTAFDAEWCRDGDSGRDGFLCHLKPDADGVYRTACAGFVASHPAPEPARVRRKKARR